MRIMSLDVGSQTIGVAVSDLFGWTAQGVETIRHTTREKDFVRLRHLADEYNVEEFVIGMPLNMNGTKGMRAEQTEKFAEALAAAFPDIPYHFWDERLTTVMAQRQLIEADVSRKKRKKVIDKMAAVVILEGSCSICLLRTEDNMMAEQKEPIIISVSDPGGIERDYVQDVVIPFAGKEFAVLVSIPEDGENVEEPEIILARVDTDKNGEAEYVPPTDEEYDAVAEIYNEM